MDMKITNVLVAAFAALCVLPSTARVTTYLNDNWTVSPALNTGGRAPEGKAVTLPHTWNAADVLEHKDYLRTAMNYKRTLDLGPEALGKRVFLRFEGVNSVATVYVNRNFAGEHKGGYTAFCFEVSNLVMQGANQIEVFVNNSYRTDVAPLVGDFNILGGIHRPVELILTDRDCISPLDYASPGVYIRQQSVSEKQAAIEVVTCLSLGRGQGDLQVRTQVLDAQGKVVASIQSGVGGQAQQARQPMLLSDPVLWNGKSNPYLYTVEVELLKDGTVVDRVVQKTGFRYFRVDPDKGFFLNGRYLDLYGFGRHEDVNGRGSALRMEDYRRDFDLVAESGATSLRLAHYPHGKPAYDLSDSLGLVLWTEIPFVGPGGFLGPGFLPGEGFREHLETSVKEMIRQNFNHPSVCFWGLFNELNFNYGDPRPLVYGLNELAKTEDPSRLTVFATFMKEDVYKGTADLIGWNKYFGWYEGAPQDLGPFMDEMHRIHPNMPVCVAEYGAGASALHHEWPVKKAKPESKWHPEEWQAMCHEGNWKELSQRRFVWGKYIWNFADFTSSVKNEGDSFGINDKGLVTYDRSVKKDAFYFYKANWNPEPMVHIASRRFTPRKEAVTDVKVYCNAPEATLYINGVKVGKAVRDGMCRIVWPGVELSAGVNRIRVEARAGKAVLSDSCEWVVEK